jgi:hypothetical protein
MVLFERVGAEGRSIRFLLVTVLDSSKKNTSVSDLTVTRLTCIIVLEQSF